MAAYGGELKSLSRALVDEAWRRGLTTPPQVTVSQWADENRVLPNVTAEPGPWRTSRVPYLKDVMDDLSTSSPVERVVLMKCAQSAGTEAALNAIGCWIDRSPGVIMMVWPTIDMLHRNSRTRIDPLFETPCLREKVAPAKSRDGGNTLDMKRFPNGELIMTGANSPTGLRSTAARYLIFDEVDAYLGDVGNEGDPIDLAVRRATTFAGRSKQLLISTPSVKGFSRIEKAFLESDQRKFFIPCPHCGEHFSPEWRDIRWPEGEPRNAFMCCPACDGRIEHHEKQGLLQKGEWRPTVETDGRIKGYHITGMISAFTSWADMAETFLASKADASRLQVWVNTVLGEPFEDRSSTPLVGDALAERGEDWGEEVPEGVALITAGVDTQNDRLEVEVVGWGKDEESWSLAYSVIPGDTSRPEVWAELDKLLLKRFFHSRNMPDMPISAACVDSGGHRTGAVMDFTAGRMNRRVWAIKGMAGEARPPWPPRPPKTREGKNRHLHIVGVDGLKDQFHRQLRIEEKAGPGVCHFPDDRDPTWYAGLVSERCVRRWIGGRPKLEWKHDPGVRNEPLDCRVYAMAALYGLKSQGVRLADAVRKLSEFELRTDGLPPIVHVPKPAMASARNGWIGGNAKGWMRR